MRKVTLQLNMLGRYDDASSFHLEREELEISFSLPKQSGEFYFLPIMNEVAGKAIYIPRGGTVSVKISETGEFKGEVKHYLRGDLIEVYHVESLIVKSVDTGFTATPEITALRQENELLRKEMNELKERAEKVFAEARERERRRDVTFISYAYAEYQSDVQLNSKNLTVEEFLLTFGFSESDFTAEELDEIKNKKEKL